MQGKDGNYDCRKPAPGTPWGPAQTIRTIADGIVHVTTASHGGIWLSPERMKRIPMSLRGLNRYGGGSWFEEDCEWAIPAVVFAGEFEERDVLAAYATLKSVYPDAYARLMATGGRRLRRTRKEVTA